MKNDINFRFTVTCTMVMHQFTTLVSPRMGITSSALAARIRV